MSKKASKIILIQAELTSMIRIKWFQMNQRLNKLRNLQNKWKKFKNSEKISLKFKLQLKFKTLKNYFEYLVKIKRKTFKCSNL